MSNASPAKAPFGTKPTFLGTSSLKGLFQLAKESQ